MKLAAFRALMKVMKKGKVLRNLRSKALHVYEDVVVVAFVYN